MSTFIACLLIIVALFKRVMSCRLTAVTVQVLSTIKLQTYLDALLLKSAFEWMHGVQREDGSFADSPADESTASRISSTSFILVCLSDIQHDDIVINRLL